MVIQKFQKFLHQFRNRVNVNQPDLRLEKFWDSDLDVVGIYTLGHYSPEVLLAAIRQEQPDVSLQETQFRHSWVKLDDHGFEELPFFQPGAQAVTMLIYE